MDGVRGVTRIEPVGGFEARETPVEGGADGTRIEPVGGGMSMLVILFGGTKDGCTGNIDTGPGIEPIGDLETGETPAGGSGIPVALLGADGTAGGTEPVMGFGAIATIGAGGGGGTTGGALMGGLGKDEMLGAGTGGGGTTAGALTGGLGTGGSDSAFAETTGSGGGLAPGSGGGVAFATGGGRGDGAVFATSRGDVTDWGLPRLLATSARRTGAVGFLGGGGIWEGRAGTGRTPVFD
jgi:hypothetical protein